MFREMRRTKQLLPASEAERILRECSHGVLALLGDEGWPYAVPMSYVYRDGRLYMHCAKAGHKLDAIRACDRASFCVVARDDVLPEKLTTLYESVIAFGRIKVLEDAEEKRSAAVLLGQKYCAGMPAPELDAYIKAEWPGLNMLELSIEHMTAKESRDLALLRQSK